MPWCEVWCLGKIWVEGIKIKCWVFKHLQEHLPDPWDSVFPCNSSWFYFVFPQTANSISFSGRSEGISHKLLALSFWREAAVSSHSWVATEYWHQSNSIHDLEVDDQFSAGLAWCGHKRTRGGVKQRLCITAKGTFRLCRWFLHAAHH